MNTYSRLQNYSPRPDTTAITAFCSDRQSHVSWDHLIATIALQIRQSFNLQTILQTTVNEVHRLIDCDRILLYQFNPDGSGQVVVESVSDPRWSLLGRTLHDTCFEPCWVAPYQEGRVAAIADVATAILTPYYREFLAQFQIKANLVIPVLNQETLWGLLLAHNCEAPRQWQTTEIEGLQQIAVHTSIAIYQASLVEQLQTAKANLEAQVSVRTVELEQTNQRLVQEVQERRRVAAEVCQREEFLRQVLDSLFTFVGVLTPDGILLEANQALLSMAGLTREEVVGNPFADLYWWSYSPETQEQIRAAIAQANQGKAVRFDIPVQVQGGKQIIIDFSLNPLRDATGKITHLIPSGVDITDRKHTELALKAKTEELDQFFSIALDLLCIADTQGNFRRLNRQWERTLGYPLAELEQSNFFDYVHPDDLDRTHNELARLINQEEVLNFVNRYQCQDGSYRWLEWRSVPVGNLIYGAARDISSRKQAEFDLKATKEQLELVLTASSEGFWDWNLITGEIYFSPQWKAMLGYTDEELNNSQEMWASLIFEDDRVATLQREEDYNSGKIDQFEAIQRFHHKDGSTVYVLSRAIHLKDEQGNVVRMVGSQLDVTENKRQELALQESEARYRNIIETTLEGVWILDVEGKTSFVNQRMTEMLGYEALEMQGNTLFSFIAPDEQFKAQAYFERQQDIQEQCLLKFQRQDSSDLWAIVSTTPLLDEQGNYLGVIGLFTDISQLVKIQEALQTSEMQLSSVLNSSLDGIMAFRSVRDEAGSIIDFEWLLSNPTACKLVGRSLESLIGQRLLVEMPGNGEEGLFDQYVQVVEAGKPAQREFYYDRDGIEIWFENIAVKLGDGFAVTFRDITAMKQSELAIQKANQELEARIQDLKQRNQEMLVLSEISNFLQACLTVKEACDAIANLVAPLFEGCSGGIFITSPSRNRVENVGSWGTGFDSALDFHPKDCWALRRGRRHLVGADCQGLRCNHISKEDAIATTLCIPMIAQGETLGLFYLSAKTAEALPEAKQQLAHTVAEQTALAIANLNLRETLQHQSIRDPLTGLFNRRYLEESLQQAISQAQRQQLPIGVVMIDIDRFKRFNDTYGHDAGDQVLQAVGNLFREIIRGSDTACRYGGEEMTLVLPGSSLEQTQTRAESIRTAISQLKVYQNGQLLEMLTASLGVAGFPQHGTTGQALLQAADAALYRAKAAGRNQVIVAP